MTAFQAGRSWDRMDGHKNTATSECCKHNAGAQTVPQMRMKEAESSHPSTLWAAQATCSVLLLGSGF